MRAFHCTFAAALLVPIALLIATDAIGGVSYTNPTGICQATLPAYEGALRKRPLAIQNEGSSNAFLTCSFTSQGTEITQVMVSFSSNDGGTHDISCTGVAGYQNQLPFFPQYVVKQGTVSAALGQKTLIWNASDFLACSPGGCFPGATKFPTPFFSLSCNLPPGVGINNSMLTNPDPP